MLSQAWRRVPHGLRGLMAVYRRALRGHCIQTWSPWPGLCGITAHATEVFVTDVAQHCVHVLSANGQRLRRWGRPGTAPGQFNVPFGIAISPCGGYVAVADCHNHRVQVFSSAGGVFITTWGEPGSGPGQLSFPQGLAYAGSHCLAVVDSGNHRMQLVDLETQRVRHVWGSEGAQPGQFRLPHDVAVDLLRSEVVVSDSVNDRVQVFALDGSLRRVLVSHSLSWPRALALQGDTVLVTNWGKHGLHALRSRTTEVIWSRSLAHDACPIGLALFRGHLLLVDAGNERICVLE